MYSDLEPKGTTIDTLVSTTMNTVRIDDENMICEKNVNDATLKLITSNSDLINASPFELAQALEGHSSRCEIPLCQLCQLKSSGVIKELRVSREANASCNFAFTFYYDQKGPSAKNISNDIKSNLRTSKNVKKGTVVKMEKWLLSHCKKFAYGYEICPKTGNKHLQGCFSLKKKLRLVNIHDSIDFSIWLAPMKKAYAVNLTYCTKDNNYRIYDSTNKKNC